MRPIHLWRGEELFRYVDAGRKRKNKEETEKKKNKKAFREAVFVFPR